MAMRAPISFVAALAVVAGLFWAMRAMVFTAEMVLDDAGKRPPIEIGRLRRDTDAKLKERKLPKREKPKPPPKTPDMDTPQNNTPGGVAVANMNPALDTGLDLGKGFQLGGAPADNDAVPVVRVEPMYPRRAAEQFIEGWVELIFDISTTGSTKNVRVAKAQPARIFDRAAIQAVRKWKYKAKIVDGRALETRGVKVRLTFKLDS